MFGFLFPNLLAFFSGFIYEACSVGWVHSTEKCRAYQAAFFSFIQVSFQVIGISDAVISIDTSSHNWVPALLYVTGYTLGSFFATKLQSKHKG